MTVGAPARWVFRPRWVLAACAGAAGLLWAAALLYLLRFDGVPAQTLWSTIFFVAFFAVALAYYARTAIFVDAHGLTYRGLLRTRRIGFADIRRVQVLPGPLTVYSVAAGGLSVHFSSLFKRHRELVALLVERAGLSSRA